jgi:hypothetical protein
MNFGLSERFFLFGIKKVLYGNEDHLKRFEILIKNYPFIDKELFPPLGDDGYLFFYDEETKEKMYVEYLEPNKHVEKWSPDYDRIIGTVLGYPPKAVEFYSSGRSKKYPEKVIYYHFCGVECVGSVDDMVDDIQWLWNTYPYPDADVLCIEYNRQYIEFEYGEIEKVKEVQKSAIKYLASNK